MSHELVTIPCLADNYAFLLRDTKSGEVALIDAPEAEPILNALKTRGWRLSQVWLTHHHWDHVDGLAEVLNAHPARVTGARADAERLPSLDHQVIEGDKITLGALEVDIIDVPGHTIGHIALYVPAAKVVFTADSLMALGCGRLFEGTPAQMWDSLQKLRALPHDTLVASGHEYTAGNAAFALTIDPDNAALADRVADITEARDQGLPTVPSLLGLEIATNPFLRPDDPAIRAGLGMENANDADVFAQIRAQKDNF